MGYRDGIIITDRSKKRAMGMRRRRLSGESDLLMLSQDLHCFAPERWRSRDPVKILQA